MGGGTFPIVSFLYEFFVFAVSHRCRLGNVIKGALVKLSIIYTKSIFLQFFKNNVKRYHHN